MKFARTGNCQATRQGQRWSYLFAYFSKLDKKVVGSRNILVFLEVKKLDSRAAIRTMVWVAAFFGRKSRMKFQLLWHSKR